MKNCHTSLLAASSINTHGWTGPDNNGDFLSRPWSNIAFMAGHRHPLTISDTAAETESSPAKQYLLLSKDSQNLIKISDILIISLQNRNHHKRRAIF